MEFIADFHIHSHYSIATSKLLIPEYLDYWAKIKGIKVIGTGDFTHPGWVKELKEKLEPAEEGLFKLKKKYILNNDVFMPRFFNYKKDISPRKAWENQPDCMSCHEGFQEPDSYQVPLNQRTESEDDLYRMRTAEAGVMCAACHGSPHALYPAMNPFGDNRDTIQPRQYQQDSLTFSCIP